MFPGELCYINNLLSRDDETAIFHFHTMCTSIIQNNLVLATSNSFVSFENKPTLAVITSNEKVAISNCIVLVTFLKSVRLFFSLFISTLQFKANKAPGKPVQVDNFKTKRTY